MKILIRSAIIHDRSSKHDQKKCDILIDNGTIATIGSKLDAADAEEIIEGEDLHVSVGWMDLYATFGDPGMEYREDIVSGLDAAGFGGFSKVAISPCTFPAIDSKSGIEYILKRASGHTVDALPLGAMTKELKNKELAEMYDMQMAGAVGISNGKLSVKNSELQNLAFHYVKNLPLTMYDFAMDLDVANEGQMHEGLVNTRLGMKGIPDMAQDIIVARDIFLAEYAGVTVHFSHVTTAGSVALLREAKQKGLPVTASVPAHHLLLTDDSVETFDANFKTLPPFRDRRHIDALVAGLKDGTIDAIISDHEPYEAESKFSEFNNAKPGIIALETAFSVAFEALNDKMELAEILSKFTTGPRAVLNIDVPSIVEGAEAELTVFSPSTKWQCKADEIRSRSKNSPMIGKTMIGLPVAVINHGKLFLNG